MAELVGLIASVAALAKLAGSTGTAISKIRERLGRESTITALQTEIDGTTTVVSELHMVFCSCSHDEALSSNILAAINRCGLPQQVARTRQQLEGLFTTMKRLECRDDTKARRAWKRLFIEKGEADIKRHVGTMQSHKISLLMSLSTLAL